MGDAKISLMIYGTRLSTSGWEPLVMLNNPPFPPLANMGVAGVGENPTYYTFRIDQNYTQYTLVYNPKYIKAHAAQRAGALKVSISIPKGYKLEGEASPYNVFIDIQRALEEHALSRIVGKQGAFEFKATFPSDEVFAQVLNSFRLVETKMPHRPMSSTSTEVGMIIADDSLCDILFKDIQYPEFLQYKEIAIAQFGESDSIIKNLDIPRKPKYEIYVNNTIITKHIQSYNYGYNDAIIIDTLRLLGYDKRAYEGEILEFTVNEVLNGKYSHLIRVDKEKELIYISLNTPKKKRISYKIVLDGCNKPDVYNYLHAYVNGRDRAISTSNTIELIGDELISSSVNINIEGKKYEINGKTSVDGTNIYVPVKEIPKQKEEKALRGWGYSSDTSNSYGEGSQKNRLIEFKFILEDPNDIKDYNKPYRVCFYNDDISFSYNRPFNRIKGDKGYFVDINIPMEWSGYYFISLKTDCAKIVSNHRRRHMLGPNSNEVRITKDETDPLTWRDKMTKSTKSLLQTLIYLSILAVVAFGVVWINNKFFQNGKVNGDEKTVEQAEEFSGNAYADELTPQINDCLSKLQDEAVSFDEIREIKSWIDNNLSKLDNNNGGIQLKMKVDGYLTVINCIEQLNNRNVGNIKQVANQEKSHLEDCHFKYLQDVWSKGNNSKGEPVLINSEQEKIVNEELKKDVVYSSFRALPAAADVLNTTGSKSTNNQKPKGNKNSTTSDKRDGDVRW